MNDFGFIPVTNVVIVSKMVFMQHSNSNSKPKLQNSNIAVIYSTILQVPYNRTALMRENNCLKLPQMSN
jgi:hypothetical protein